MRSGKKGEVWARAECKSPELELELELSITKDSAAGLSGRACFTRIRSDEKGEVWGERRRARRLNE